MAKYFALDELNCLITSEEDLERIVVNTEFALSSSAIPTISSSLFDGVWCGIVPGRLLEVLEFVEAFQLRVKVNTWINKKYLRVLNSLQSQWRMIKRQPRWMKTGSSLHTWLKFLWFLFWIATGQCTLEGVRSTELLILAIAIQKRRNDLDRFPSTIFPFVNFQREDIYYLMRQRNRPLLVIKCPARLKQLKKRRDEIKSTRDRDSISWPLLLLQASNVSCYMRLLNNKWRVYLRCQH